MHWVQLKEKKLDYYNGHFKAGKIDKDIIPLLDKINGKSNYVTSSSCYGRIALLSIKQSKRDASHYYKNHGTVIFQDLLNKIKKYNDEKPLMLLVEPFILHVYVKDLGVALNFMSLINKAGIRRGGIKHIKDHPFIEVSGSGSLALPVHDGKNIIISEDYLKYVVQLSNKIFKNNVGRLKKLEDLL